MSRNSIVVQGTLKPDGTSAPDEKPTFAPAASVSCSSPFRSECHRRVVGPRRSSRCCIARKRFCRPNIRWVGSSHEKPTLARRRLHVMLQSVSIRPPS